jgi:hypothetical protein
MQHRLGQGVWVGRRRCRRRRLLPLLLLHAWLLLLLLLVGLPLCLLPLPLLRLPRAARLLLLRPRALRLHVRQLGWLRGQAIGLQGVQRHLLIGQHVGHGACRQDMAAPGGVMGWEAASMYAGAA